jgi:hypothetical protein
LADARRRPSSVPRRPSEEDEAASGGCCRLCCRRRRRWGGRKLACELLLAAEVEQEKLEELTGSRSGSRCIVEERGRSSDREKKGKKPRRKTLAPSEPPWRPVFGCRRERKRDEAWSFFSLLSFSPFLFPLSSLLLSFPLERARERREEGPR